MNEVIGIRRKSRAFTLSETIIVVAMMIVFIGALYSALIAGLRYWNDGSLRLKSQEALRESLDTMTTELRQAIPNPDPGTGGNPPTGYILVDPSIDPTGLLYPNVHNTVGDYIEFTEPVESVYIPSGSGWVAENPANYQKIRYFISGGILKRRVTLYNSSGQLSSQTENDVVTLRDGSLDMEATFLSPTFIEIEMTASLGKFSYTIKTKVKTGG